MQVMSYSTHAQCGAMLRTIFLSILSNPLALNFENDLTLQYLMQVSLQM